MLELALQCVGALCEQQLMLAQGQQIARTRDEFVVIDRRIQKIRGAGIEGLQAEASLFVDGYDDDGNLGAVLHCPKTPDELGAVEMRHFIIGDDEIGRVVLQPVQRFEWVAKRLDLDARLDRGGEFGKNVPVRYAVVNDYDDRHRFPPARGAPPLLAAQSTQWPDIIKGIRTEPVFGQAARW